jgi:hypothetical protein
MVPIEAVAFDIPLGDENIPDPSQTTRTLYIFISATSKDMQATEGSKPGGKVVDYGPDFSRLKVPKGVAVEIYTIDDPRYKGKTILEEGHFKAAIRDKNALGVLVVGHGAGGEDAQGVFKALGIAVGRNYVFATDRTTSPLEAHAPLFGVFGCDGKGASKAFQDVAKSAIIIGLDGGKDGYASVNAIAHAGFAAAQAILKRESVKVVTQQSNSAFIKAMRGTANFNNDKIIRIQ